MTRQEATKINHILADIEDFELLYDQIDIACKSVEGDFTKFLNEQLYPLLDAELERRKKILENI